MKVNIPDSELDKFAPYINEALETKLEFAFLYVVIEKFPKGNNFYEAVDYTLDSYLNLKVCMDNSTAKRNSLYNGLEYILSKHYLEEYKSGNTEAFKNEN